MSGTEVPNPDASIVVSWSVSFTTDAQVLRQIFPVCRAFSFSIIQTHHKYIYSANDFCCGIRSDAYYWAVLCRLLSFSCTNQRDSKHIRSRHWVEATYLSVFTFVYLVVCRNLWLSHSAGVSEKILRNLSPVCMVYKIKAALIFGVTMMGSAK